MRLDDLLLLSGAGNIRPPYVPRAPLPPFPPPVDYATTLPWTPPETRDFLRANAWGVTIPGLPFVPGGSTNRPSGDRVLSWFLDRWTPSWQQRILTQHAQDGYSHFVLSAPDSIQGNGLSLGQFVDLCALVKAWGFHPVVFLGSKDYQPRDMNNVDWIQYLSPLMAALDGVVDEYVPGWEWDLWNVPGDTTLYVCKAVGEMAHAQGASCWLHFSTHVTWWGQDGSNRFVFWDDLGPDVDGLMYQTDPTWSIGEMQARIVDSLWQFGTQGNVHKFRLFEDLASLMFDHPTPTEVDGNQRGFCACCTVDNVRHTDAKVWGYGNGGQLPNGDAL